MKNKIIILGKGYVGSILAEGLGCQATDKRINSFQDAQDIIDEYQPEVIINAIGHIGRNVDDCELDKEKTLSANAFIPIKLAEVALRNNIRFLHLSSGCIYNYNYSSNIPIKEVVTPDSFDLFYSRCKIYSESAIEGLSKKFPILIVRIRIPLDNRPHPRNILTKLISYKKVIDVSNSITYLPNFIEALKHLIQINAVGIYNVVNKGGLKYPDLMDIYRKYHPDFKYEVINCRQLKTPRTNLVLSTDKLEKTGFKMPDIYDVLEDCVSKYVRF